MADLIIPERYDYDQIAHGLKPTNSWTLSIGNVGYTFGLPKINYYKIEKFNPDSVVFCMIDTLARPGDKQKIVAALHLNREQIERMLPGKSNAEMQDFDLSRFLAIYAQMQRHAPLMRRDLNKYRLGVIFYAPPGSQETNSNKVDEMGIGLLAHAWFGFALAEAVTKKTNIDLDRDESARQSTIIPVGFDKPLDLIVTTGGRLFNSLNLR